MSPIIVLVIIINIISAIIASITFVVTEKFSDKLYLFICTALDILTYIKHRDLTHDWYTECHKDTEDNK